MVEEYCDDELILLRRKPARTTDVYRSGRQNNCLKIKYIFFILLASFASIFFCFLNVKNVQAQALDNKNNNWRDWFDIFDTNQIINNINVFQKEKNSNNCSVDKTLKNPKAFQEYLNYLKQEKKDRESKLKELGLLSEKETLKFWINQEKEYSLLCDQKDEKYKQEIEANGVEDWLKSKKRIEKMTGQMEAVVAGYPISEMVPYIVRKDKITASFLISIAKKESNWGKHVPRLYGADCYNYWGYKGAGSRGLAMGYGCFASPEEAVSVVGGRIGELVKKDLSTPARMVVWKCGSTCAGHSQQSVSKWISDVNLYFYKISKIQ